MPERYLAIKRSLHNKYRSEKLRKRHAAKIENALRRKEGKPPMGPHSDKKGD